MADEGRRIKRRHLIFYLEVYNEETDELLGHVVDITTQGIKLVTKDPLEKGKKFKMRMALPEGYFDVNTLHFEGKCLWSTNDVNPDFYDAGFDLSGSIDDASMNMIASLIDQIGFND